MNDKELWRKRVVPALEQMYLKSKHFFGTDQSFGWSDLLKYSYRDESGKKNLPIDAFLISKEDYDAELKKATAHLRKNWRWIYRSEIIYDDKDIEEMKVEIAELQAKLDDCDYTREEVVGRIIDHQYENDDEYKDLIAKRDYIVDIEVTLEDLSKKVKYNDINKEREEKWKQYLLEREALIEEFDSKKIDRKEFNKRYDNLCKSYDMQLRSRDAEKVQFTIFDFCPTSSLKSFEELEGLYQKLCWRLKTNRCQDVNMVKSYAQDICSEDKMRNLFDLIAAYMLYSNFLNQKENTDC